MHLAELSLATGAPVSSIKFWLRQGVLPPGEKINARTAEYGERHVDRIELIQLLREDLRAPTAQISELTALLDDPDADVLAIQERCQILALGLHRPPAGDRDWAGERVAELCAELGWPNFPSWPRAELTALVRDHPSVVETGLLRSYALAFDSVARTNLATVSRAESLDRRAIDLLRGVALTLRVEKAVSAMAHASASMLRAGAPPTENHRSH